MSAFIVSNRHIDTLAAYAAYLHTSYWHNGRHHSMADPQHTAALLFAANVKSVNHRYDDNTPTDGYVYSHTPPATGVPAVGIIKACNCLEYQSCEPDDWEESEARAALDTIRHAAACRLPGYEDAAWEIRP